MTPDEMHDDLLDPVIRNRRLSGKPAVDMLNSTVPQADANRRDALEQRLMARVPKGEAPGKNRPMIHNAALQGAYETPRRFRLSTSMLLTTTVGMLVVAVLVFSSVNRPPSEESPWAVAPLNQDQEAGTPTPTPYEATATPIPFTGDVTQPPGSAVTGIPVTFSPSAIDVNATATPLGAGDVVFPTDTPTLLSQTATPVPFVTSTPIPFSVNLYVPTYVPFAGDHVAPPSVWFFGDAHVSAPNSSGLMIQLPANRVEGTSGETPIAAGRVLNLYTMVSVPKEYAPAGATDRDLENPSDVVVALVPVAASIEVMSVNEEGSAIVRVSVEQGIVLNWLLNDTPARIYYGRTE